jgi:hypothetical protein
MPFVLLDPSSTQLIVDGQYATLTDAGPYALTLRVTSSRFSAIFTDYSFQVVLTACYANQFTFSATISDVIFE